MPKRKKLLIVDSFALIFRAFYAFIKNPLRTSRGEPTSAIFGFVRMLIKVIKDYQPDYLVMALDSPGKTFRNDIYEEYKANRKDTPEDLKIQIPQIIELIDKFKVASLIKEGFEADDIIGTLCEKYKNTEDVDIYVVTGDKDILQLVEGNIRVLTTSKGISELKEYDREAVKEKWGVYPENIVELFALMGDSSDNVPGVKGVGPKSALDLLEQYHNLEGIYENIEKITKKKLKENLIEFHANAVLSKELVTIDRHVPLDLALEDFANTDLAQEEAVEALKSFELHSVLKDEVFVRGGFSDTSDTPDLNGMPTKDDTLKRVPNEDYKAILTVKDWQAVQKEISDSGLVSIDLETTSENPNLAEIIGISFSTKEKTGYYLPLAHEVAQEIERDVILADLKRLCEDKEVRKIGQNIKYDYMILRRYGIECCSIIFDTMIASYILNPARKSHGMDHLAMEFLGHHTIKYKDIVGKGETLLDVDFDMVVQYAAEDADITLRLYQIFKPAIDSSSMRDLYYNVELPLVTVLGRIELAGVVIDKNYFRTMSQDFAERLNLLESEIWELSGQEFNINSTKQLSEILFTKLGLEAKKKTSTGFSTDVSVLEKLAEEHQVPLLLLEFRKLTKLKSAYLDSIPKLINKLTGRVHTSFNQTVTQTGRLSSNKPNLQNIPIKEDIGRAIRKGFLAREGNYIMSADYSQIELRILAHMSQDPALLKAYQEDRDIHTQTAALIFGKPESTVDQDERRIAKTINFSVIYGIGSQALAKDLKISAKQAKTFIDQYFKEYRGVRDYIDRQKELAHEQGYVETMFHRIRYLPEIKSSNKREISFGERLAVNTPIQGTSADIIKMAMIEIDREIEKNHMKSLMTIQVHDELVFELPENELDTMKSLVREKMESATTLSVPLKVSLSYGLNWEEAH